MYQVTTLKEIEKAINENGEVVVKKDAENNIIVMSVEEYDKAEIKAILKEIETNPENGKVMEIDEMFEELNEKYKYR